MFEESISRIIHIENGFRGIQDEARKITTDSNPTGILSHTPLLLKHNAYQVRSLAVFMLGNIACAEAGALALVREQARMDESWQVQEIIAKAFDKFCSDKGYEAALPEIKDWLSDPHPNVCRAVTEGLRIWTGRPYFKEHPEVAIQLIAQHKDNPSEYLRKSVGNALRDISKKFPELVLAETDGWDKNNPLNALTLRHVLRRC